MNEEISQAVLTAKSKVLATIGADSVNAVPVSAIQIHGDIIWLFNFFMDKTAKNILQNPSVSLVCWSGTTGYQIKGHVVYEESGDNFDEAKIWAEEAHPDRTLKGVLLLEPEKVYNISI